MLIAVVSRDRNGGQMEAAYCPGMYTFTLGTKANKAGLNFLRQFSLRRGDHGRRV